MYHELETCYSPLTGTTEQNLLECHSVLDWLIVFVVPQFVSKEPFVDALIKEQFCHLVPLKSFLEIENAVVLRQSGFQTVKNNGDTIRSANPTRTTTVLKSQTGPGSTKIETSNQTELIPWPNLGSIK